MSSISKSPQPCNVVSFPDCMPVCAFRLALFIFSACLEGVRGCKAQTGCRLDWDSNCHFESDKVLIWLPGTERLDITVDKWAGEQNWQDAREDKMPSARVFSPICYHSWTIELKILNWLIIFSFGFQHLLIFLSVIIPTFFFCASPS